MAESKLVLHRKFKGPEYTIGKLYRVSGKNEVYICDILEDTVRNSITTTINRFIKIYGKTAIPYGTYEITRTYSNRFKRFYRYFLMFRIMKVLEFIQEIPQQTRKVVYFRDLIR